MKANPGGQIDPKAMVGRDHLIQTLWETVAQQSVVMTAERRIGKTTVMKRMQEEPPPGWVPVFQDLEGYHSAAEFAQSVYREIHLFLTARKRVARRAQELFKVLGGTQIGGLFKLPEQEERRWKDVLTQSIEDLVRENDAEGTRLLFLWDEMPFMLSNIRDREGERTAMEVLDLLRALRMTHADLRMIITGSIGLHHVLTSLRDKDYANSPVNDMAKIDVPPLADDDAVTLATLLIEGEQLSTPDGPAAAKAIAREADQFPFYIHHVVKALKVRDWTATPEHVAEVVALQLVDANDPWELQHYRVRIPTYYHTDEKAVCLILDQLATAPEAATVDSLLAMLKSSSTFDDRERLLRILELMERDHYLTRDVAGRYQFRFPLIRRWWKLKRGR